MSAKSDLSRREFLVQTTVAGGTLLAWPAANLFAAARPSADCAPDAIPVISFHMDQPYIDATGTAMPYVPAPGARSAAAFCECDEAMLRHHHCYGL